MNALLVYGILLITPMTCLEISDEEERAGILITPYNTMNIQETTTHLAYTFDVSSVKYILNWHNQIETVYSTMKTICNEKHALITPLEIEVENAHWLKSKPMTQNMSYIKIINMTLFHDAVLRANVKLFNEARDEQDECFYMIKIMQNFREMNNILNNLAQSELSVLEQIISNEHLLMDVQSLLREFLKNKATFPFDFSFNFLRNFLKYTNFKLFYNNDFTITLLFSIPTFKMANVYKLYAKPIVQNSIPRILQTQQKYLVSLNNKYIFFDEFTYETNCILIANTRFCTAPEAQNNCEIDALNKLFSSPECFRELPKENIIAQIEEETYFTIFNPLIVDIICKSTNFSIRLTQNLKIINDELCTISTTFFEFSKDSPTYGIFVAGNSESGIIWATQSNYIKWEIYLNFGYFISFILFCGISIGTTIYFKRQRLQREKARNHIRIRLSKTFEPYIKSSINEIV